MVKLICDGCEREVNVTQEKLDSLSRPIACKECGSDMNEPQEEEDEDEIYSCENCDEEKDKEQLIFLRSEEDEEDFNFVFCKSCINNAYKVQPEIIYKEKIVEKPIIRYVNQEGQETKKEEIKETFKSLF